MGHLSVGQSVGTWDSAFGQATITVKKEIGQGYQSQSAAVQASVGKQAVVTQEEDGRFHAYHVDDGANFDDLDRDETVRLKTGIPRVKVLDLVGDDGYQLKAQRKELPPLGPDNGKVVYFMRYPGTGWKDKIIDFVDGESRWNEEIKQTRKKGYTVIVDPITTSSELKEAFYDPRTAGVIFSGHGAKNYVALEAGGISPSSIDPERVSKNLKMVVFQSCSSAKSPEDWQEKLNGAAIIGWKRTVNAIETAAANDPVLFGFAGPLGLGLAIASDVTGKSLDKQIDKHL